MIQKLLWSEPKIYFSFSSIDAVRCVDTVLLTSDTVGRPDGTRLSQGRVGGAYQNSACPNDLISLPDHTDNGTRRNKFSDTLKKGLSTMLLVVGLSVFHWHLGQLESYELEASLTKFGDD